MSTFNIHIMYAIKNELFRSIDYTYCLLYHIVVVLRYQFQCSILVAMDEV